MASILKYNKAQHTNATDAMTIDASGYITASQPVLARIHMTQNQNNLTEQRWNKMQWDYALIDTKSGFDNSNDRYTIPIAGYYRIYVQALMGIDGESGSLRDSGICITRTRGGTQTQLAFSTNRYYDGATDGSDATEQIYVIDDCQTGDHIEFYTYVNSDTGTDYDVFCDVDAGNNNTHLNTQLPGSGIQSTNPISYFTIERIL